MYANIIIYAYMHDLCCF